MRDSYGEKLLHYNFYFVINLFISMVSSKFHALHYRDDIKFKFLCRTLNVKVIIYFYVEHSSIHSVEKKKLWISGKFIVKFTKKNFEFFYFPLNLRLFYECVEFLSYFQRMIWHWVLLNLCKNSGNFCLSFCFSLNKICDLM